MPNPDDQFPHRDQAMHFEPDAVTLTFEVEITTYPDADDASPTEQQIEDALYLAGVLNRGEGDVVVRQI